MTDALIVNPAAARQNYGALADGLTAVEPPVWCRIIAGYLGARGFACRIADAEALGLTTDALAALAEAASPRLAVVVAHGHQPSASTQTMDAAYAAASALQRVAPTIVVGGHASALPERTLAETDARWVCDGEGPATVEALLSGRPEELVPGLVWRGPGGTVRNPPAALLRAETEDLEGDAWGEFDLGTYRAHNWQCFGGWPRSPYASLYTSFGCPFRCDFCMINAPFHANRYRARRPERVVREVEALYRERGVRTFKFSDEMFVLRPSHYLAVCDGLARLGLGDAINVWCYARVDTIREGDLALMRRAGVRWVALGIESADPAVRDGSNKAMRPRDVAEVVRSVQRAGISVIGNYIFGLPGDDASTMRATLDLALECRTEFANFYCAMAYPGSQLYDRAVAEGAALPETWGGYAQHSYDSRPLDTGRVSARDVVAFRDAAFAEYYADGRYLEAIRRKFGDGAVAEVAGMAARRLPRKLLEAAA